MITRLCDACGQLIKPARYHEVQVRVMETGGEQTQDASEQSYGDFCDKCVRGGAAIKYLLENVK